MSKRKEPANSTLSHLKRQKNKESITSKKSVKRARLGVLPGSYKLPPELVKTLKIPDFISTLEVRYWKSEEQLAKNYTEQSVRIKDPAERVLSVIIRVMKSIAAAPQIRSDLAEYCAAVASQYKSCDSKNRFRIHIERIKKELEIKENEEEATMEAKVASRILTTLETKNHKVELRRRLDVVIKDEQSVVEEDNISDCSVEVSVSSDDNPFTEKEYYPSLKIVKEKNLYKFQAPSNHVVSPNKPILQCEDLSVLKAYFDICISNSTKEATEDTYLEYQSYMMDQKQYSHLKRMPGVFDIILDILDSSEQDLLTKVVALPSDSSFIDFVKFTMIDFVLNCKRPGLYNKNDERSVYCEIIIPLFKAFGNCTGSLTYGWCEKKAKHSDYVWLVSNDFNTIKKDNMKLLDGVGQMTISNIMNYLLMESSGYNNDSLLSHSINDTLKNIKSGHDNLKSFISNYRQSSFKTIQQVHLFSCQIIHNKMTLIKYSIQSVSTWKVVECRSASVPMCFSDILQYMKVFEFFAFLLDDIDKQKNVFKQLEREHLGIVSVEECDTVAHCLL